ncbi:major facilitator superfamily domain-containing protein [Pelagophyceae sp. CCMP2097]|nr:major facilitator superfamily domain-containing protein [Pelagophyceae sp. CCMP2097]
MSAAPLARWGSIFGMQRDVVKLSLCWACTLTASTLLTACGPLAARSVGASTSLAPFAIGMFLLGAAVISLPSARMFRVCGRAGGFMIGCALGLVGALIGIFATEVAENATAWIFVACFLIGVSQGMGQFYRFAASELCDRVEERASAVTLVLAGGVISSFAGPLGAYHTRFVSWPALHVETTDFTGCFVLVALANVVNAAIILTITFADVRGSTAAALSAPLVPRAAPRGAWTILRERDCACAVLTASLAHTAMVALMSPLTIAMADERFSYDVTTTTLELHFLSMYAPGLLGAGALIRRAGPHRAAVVGLVLFAACAGTLSGGQLLGEYCAGMVLCGLAWHLCFSSATVMLTTCYTPAEAPEVQGLNDFIIFGCAGCGSLASGYVYAAFGWERLVYGVSALMLAFGAGVLTLALRAPRPAKAPAYAQAGAEPPPGDDTQLA